MTALRAKSLGYFGDRWGFWGGALRRLRVQQLLLTAFRAGLSLVLAYVLVRRSAALAFVLPLIVPALWLLARRDAGVLAGLTLLLMLPSWLTVGIAQVNVLRVASLAAASTLLFSRQRQRIGTTDVALGLMVLTLILGWMLQPSGSHAGRVLGIELTPLGFYFGVRAIAPTRLQAMFRTMLFAGTVGALTVIYEYVAGHAVFVDALTYKWNGSPTTIFRPGGIFGGPPQASTVLCVVVIVGLAAVRDMRGRMRMVAHGCLVVCVAGLALTFTRAGLIGLGVGVIAYLWLTHSSLLRPTRVIFGAGVILLIALAVLPTLQRNTSVKEGIFRSGTLAAREGYWTAAEPIVTHSVHNALFGVGTAALETPTLAASVPVPLSEALRPQVYTNSLHSEYVTLLVENGAIGLVLLVALLVVPCARGARRCWATGDPIAAAAAASLLSIAVVMTVNTALLDGPSFTVLLVSAGVLAGRSVRAPTATGKAEVG